MSVMRSHAFRAVLVGALVFGFGLEHREPGGPGDRPGMLVQYSCTRCPEVVVKLTRIVERYARGEYYPPMSPRIALTTLGRVEAMNKADEARMVAFREKRL